MFIENVRDISIWDSGADTHLQGGNYLHFCAKQTWKRHNDFEGFSVAVPKNNTGVINTTYKHPSSSVWQFANSQGISDDVMLQAADHHPVMNHISSLKGSIIQWGATKMYDTNINFDINTKFTSRLLGWCQKKFLPSEKGNKKGEFCLIFIFIFFFRNSTFARKCGFRIIESKQEFSSSENSDQNKSYLS